MQRTVFDITFDPEYETEVRNELTSEKFGTEPDIRCHGDECSVEVHISELSRMRDILGERLEVREC